MAVEPVGGWTTESVTPDQIQCDARPTVTFPAAKRHRPLTTGTKLYCSVNRGTDAWEQLAQGRYAAVLRPEVEPTTFSPGALGLTKEKITIKLIFSK